MTLRVLASRLWFFGWFLAWIFAFGRALLSPEIVSILALLFGASGLLTGLYFFVRGFQLLQRKRWIEDTPVTKIDAAAMGQVKVLGKATGPYTLLSPLAGVDCYYYRAVAWNGRDAQNDQELQRRATETLFAPFFVEDETGRLMIDPRGAQLELPAEYDEQILGESMGEGSRRFLRRHALSTRGETTVSEYAIKPGDPLLVIGTLAENHGLGSMADAEGRKSRDTYLSREAADLQRREQLEAMGVPPTELPDPITSAVPDEHPRVVLCAGDGHVPFVLSRQTPQRMIDNLARRSTIGIWGGPVLALLSLGLVMKWLSVW